MLETFFVVTTTSLYRVLARDPAAHGGPSAEKIALRTESKLKVGDKLSGGDMLSIGKRLISFIPEGGGTTSLQRRIEMVNVTYHLKQSSSIVALFLTEEAARVCFATGSQTPGDSHWRADTEAVMSLLDDKHPTISVCLYAASEFLGFKFSDAF
jgi:hypothetical protein